MTVPEDDVGLVWFALRVNPRCEHRAANGLRARGLRAFVPEETVWRKRYRRPKPERAKRPLFVRYIFCGVKPGMNLKMDMPKTWVVTIDDRQQEVNGYERIERQIACVEQAFWDIRRTDGVESIVGIEGMPVAIPPGMVSELIYGTASGIFDKTRKPFKAGDNVRLSDGPFDGFIGKVIQAKRSGRIEVLLSLFGKGHKVEVDPMMLRAAAAA